MDRFRGGGRDLYEDAAPHLHAVCLWSQRHHAVFCETALRREGRGEAGVVDCSHGKDVFGGTQRQGRGMFHPLPGEPPPPGGRFPIDTVPCRRQTLIGLTENSMKSRFLPVHGIRTIAMHCPPPVEGAGGGAGSAGRRGWSTARMEKTSSLGRSDRGGGVPPPSPASPSPRG